MASPHEAVAEKSLSVKPVVSSSALALVALVAFTATLGAQVAPSIVTQPDDLTIVVGDYVYFNVTANGSEPLSYQWWKNGTAIADATDAMYLKDPSVVTDAGAYTVKVSNLSGSVTSVVATLTVLIPPAITTQPVSKTVIVGSNVTFTVKGTGTAPLDYQWYRDNAPIDGATATNLTLLNVQPGDAGEYTVAVGNAARNYGASDAVSDPATLTVWVPVSIIDQPDSGVANQGGTVLLSVQADGTEPLTYQWVFKGTSIIDQTDTLLELLDVDALDEGNYYVIVGNPVGSVASSNAYVSINTRPVFTLQPVTRTVYPGSNVTFSAAVTGTPPISYQWYRNGLSIEDATNASYTFFVSNTAPRGTYAVTAENMVDEVWSQEADLVVKAETVNPTVSFTVPTEGLRWSNAVMTVRGKAADNAVVDFVEFADHYEPAGAGFHLAIPGYTNTSVLPNVFIWTNWTMIYAPAPGTNLVRAVATDDSGNRSTTAEARYFYVVPSPFTLVTNGPGTASTNLGQNLEIGKDYTLTALPGPGAVFTNWTGGYTSTNVTFKFMMKSNLTLTMNFKDVQKPVVTVISALPEGSGSNALTVVSGTATDNWRVASVWYQFNSSAWTLATGTTNWAASVALLAGTNVFRTYSLDAAGNLSLTNTFVISKALATVTLGSLSQTYDGTARSATATTAPPELTVNFTYNGSTNAPTNTGSYAVIGTISDANYQGSATNTLVIGKATAIVTLGNLAQTYDGNARSATATTAPPGLTVNFTYNGSVNAPTNAGSYTVIGTISDSNYQGSATNTLVIGKAAAIVTLGDLSQAYDGTARSAPATTAPPGLTVNFSYNGSVNALTNAGSYTVIGTINDANYAGSATNTLVISKAAATVTLGSLSQTYDGTARGATATTTPLGLTVGFTYNGSINAPTNEGSYTIIGTISDANYQGSATNTLVIGKAAAAVTLGGLSQTYDGTARSATAATTPPGLAVGFTYNGWGSAPTNAGSYTVIGTINDVNYAGGATNTLVIGKAAATVTLGDLSQTCDGTARNVSVTTMPPGLSVDLTYNGSPNAPTNFGSYTVIGAINEANYQGGATNPLVIGCPAITLSPATLPGGSAGSNYNFTVSASGGSSPYTYAVTSGSLPGGLSLAGGGVISGTPTTNGSFGFTITANDRDGCSGSQSYALGVSLSLWPMTLPEGAFGVAYSTNVTAIGGDAPYTYAVTAGALPDGWALNSTDGGIAGTPTRTGSNTFTLTATDASGHTVSVAYTVTVICAGIMLSPDSLLTSGRQGSNYSVKISASGGAAPYTFALSSGSLPAGLTLAGGGLLSGMASTGAYNFTITATDSNGCTRGQEYGLTVLAPGASLPTVTILNPLNNRRVFTTPTNLTGLAREQLPRPPVSGVAEVRFGLNGGPVTNLASGTTNWSASVAMVPGTNIFVAKCRDLAGNVSLTRTGQFILSASTRLTVRTNGVGAITPTTFTGSGTPTNGAWLELGRAYTVTAVPGTNFLFTNWTASVAGGPTSVVSASARYTFMMQSNLSLGANFVTNRFIAAAGSYYGLFFDEVTPLVSHERAGFFTLKTDSKQKFSGKLYLDGNTLSYAGALDLAGHGVSTPVIRKGKSALRVTVNLTFDGSDSVSGSVICFSNTPYAPQGPFTSAMTGFKAGFNLTDHPATNLLGTYTLALEVPTVALSPKGNGHGIITVKPNGSVVLAGYLGDYASFKPVAVPISKDGDWPLYASAYLGNFIYTNPVTMLPVTNKEYKGSVIGWMRFTNHTEVPTGRELLDSSVHWIKTPNTNNFYVDGFTNHDLMVFASAYFAPTNPKSIRALGLTNGNMVFLDGNLTATMSNRLFLNTNSAIKIDAPNVNTQTMAIAVTTGKISGKFYHPNDPLNRVRAPLGVVLQDENLARGVFKGTNGTGSFILRNN